VNRPVRLGIGLALVVDVLQDPSNPGEVLIPAGKGTNGIPGPLSAIMMKLLARTAAERYQTAAGVAPDYRLSGGMGGARPHWAVPALRAANRARRCRRAGTGSGNGPIGGPWTGGDGKNVIRFTKNVSVRSRQGRLRRRRAQLLAVAGF